MEVVPFGRSAVLIRCDPAVVPAVADLARRSLAAVDVVPGAESVLVDGVAIEAAVATISTWQPPAADALVGARVEIPVRYDGPDLVDVAALWGMAVPEAVEMHRGLEFVVAFCGFAPGFAYLGGLPQHLTVPRLASPRPRVPAGSLAVADQWTGIYPTASPGGWRLIGSTDVVLWDSAQTPPALLTPGTRVRFVEA